MIFSKNYVNPFLIKYVNDKFMNIWIMNLWKYASFSKNIESDHEKHLKELINIIVKFFLTYFYDHDCERYLSHMNSHWWIIFFIYVELFLRGYCMFWSWTMCLDVDHFIFHVILVCLEPWDIDLAPRGIYGGGINKVFPRSNL